MQSAPQYLLTSRLKLRRWQESDLAPFARLNASTEVMRFFPKVLTRAESDAIVARITSHFEKNGFGLWAVETRETAEFAGFVGLQSVSFEAHFTPCVEVGWRLMSEFWGRGYAVEAARSAMLDGFERLKLSEIVSMTSLHNTPSIRVMQKLGMVRDASDDFDHPNISADSKLCRHLLYKMTAHSASRVWEASASQILET